MTTPTPAGYGGATLASLEHLARHGPYDHSQPRLGAVRSAVCASQLIRQTARRGVAEDAVESFGTVGHGLSDMGGATRRKKGLLAIGQAPDDRNLSPRTARMSLGLKVLPGARRGNARRATDRRRFPHLPLGKCRPGENIPNSRMR